MKKQALASTTALLTMLLPHSPAADLLLGAPVVHSGLPDGSAAISAGDAHFIAACDEDNVLRLFSIDGRGTPKPLLDLNPVLGFKPKKDGTFRECDLEAAARIADLVYWIGSHGTNKDGKERRERQIFFATEVRGEGPAITLYFTGEPCKSLIAALGKLPHLDLADAAEKAPEEGGLNIESLCAQGDALLIGFRGPVRPEGAIIVPLVNPRAVVEEGAPPKLGTPFTLDLGGRGVRDMAPWNGQFLIVGGDSKDRGLASALYLWTGDPKSQPRELHHFEDLNPEAIVIHHASGKPTVRILSDDGGESFRSVSMEIK